MVDYLKNCLKNYCAAAIRGRAETAAPSRGFVQQYANSLANSRWHLPRFGPCGVLLPSLLFLASAAVLAEDLPDPTRPALSELPAAAAVQEKGGGEPVLQSVLMSPTRKAAIINGQTVPLGGRFGEARLIRIGEGEVVLQTGDALKTLKLFPDVDKQAVKGKAGAKQPKR